MPRDSTSLPWEPDRPYPRLSGLVWKQEMGKRRAAQVDQLRRGSGHDYTKLSPNECLGRTCIHDQACHGVIEGVYGKT